MRIKIICDETIFFSNVRKVVRPIRSGRRLFHVKETSIHFSMLASYLEDGFPSTDLEVSVEKYIDNQVNRNLLLVTVN